jgi:hypothetical protein
MAKTSTVFNKINTLRERYYKASIGKEALIKLISEAEIADQVYNSNAIENSTLSLEETEKILLQIDLDRYYLRRKILLGSSHTLIRDRKNRNWVLMLFCHFIKC